MKKLVLLLTALTACFSAIFAQNVTIPDANFKAALLANSAINVNLDGQIQVTEAANFLGPMNVSNLGISNLSGIEAFISLHKLDFSQNSVTSVDLSANYYLDTLKCNNNLLTCLDLYGNYNLKYLDCQNNNLLKLNVHNYNNFNVVYFNALGNNSLGCVQVDNAANATAAWTNIPPSATFSNDCGQPVAGFTSDSPVCYGDTLHFTNTSTNGVTYTWSFGDGNYSSAINPSHYYTGFGGYTVIVTAHSNCYGSSNYSNNVYMNASSLNGNVSYSGGAINMGSVVLLKYQPMFTMFDTVAVTSTDNLGNFYISYPPAGNYIVKVYADTTLYPTVVPSYHTSEWAWDSADVFTHGCAVTDTVNVVMVETPPILGGPGHLAGTIVEGPGFGRAQGDPVHGVDVKLGVMNSSQIIGCTTTDTLGHYTFTNVPYGNYVIYAIISGLHRDSTYQVTIDSSTTSFTNLDYIVDSNSVYIFVNVGIEEHENSTIQSFGLYPNPTRDITHIVYSLTKAGEVQIHLYDLLGSRVATVLNTQQEEGDHVFSFNASALGIQPGLYLVQIQSGNRAYTLRMIVTG